MLDLPVRLALDKKKFGDTDLKMLYLKVTHNSFFQNTLATIKKKTRSLHQSQSDFSRKVFKDTQSFFRITSLLAKLTKESITTIFPLPFLRQLLFSVKTIVRPTTLLN